MCRAQEEEAARKAEADRLEQEQERKAVVATFLKENGFKGGVNDGKRSMITTSFPIHCAAEKGDERIVRMLLQEGANPNQLTSSFITALELAQWRDNKGSHTGVIQALGCHYPQYGRCEAHGEPSAWSPWGELVDDVPKPRNMRPHALIRIHL